MCFVLHIQNLEENTLGKDSEFPFTRCLFQEFLGDPFG